eukprot:scaffold1440_cov377-Prasinococcus_capsulatus_cf.AAC.3
MTGTADACTVWSSEYPILAEQMDVTPNHSLSGQCNARLHGDPSVEMPMQGLQIVHQPAAYHCVIRHLETIREHVLKHFVRRGTI